MFAIRTVANMKLCRIAGMHAKGTRQMVPPTALRWNSSTLISFGEKDFSGLDMSKQIPYTDIQQLHDATDSSASGIKMGDHIIVKGRVETTRTSKGNMCFVVLRSKTFNTIQCCNFRDKKNVDEEYSSNFSSFVDFVDNIPAESIVEIHGQLASANVKSCSIKHAEIQINEINVISRAMKVLPFSVMEEAIPLSQSDMNATFDAEDRDETSGEQVPNNGSGRASQVSLLIYFDFN